MENVINLNNRNIYSFVHELKYGTNDLLISESVNRGFFIHVLETYNLACNSEVLRFRQFVNVATSNEFELILTERKFTFPSLKDDDFNLEILAKDAFRYKDVLKIDISEYFIKHAYKIGKRNGVKLIQNGDEFFFSGASKEKPVSTQINEAYLAGETSISFPLNKHVSNTLRCYASSIGNDYGKKFRCSTDNGELTIWFKELEPIDRFMLELKHLEKKFSDNLTIDEFNTVFSKRIYDLTGHTFIPLQPSNDSEIMDVEWDDDYDRPEDDTDTISDPAAHFGSGDYDDDEPEERDYEAEANAGRVSPDDINQSYISELYEKTPQDEDDDF